MGFLPLVLLLVGIGALSWLAWVSLQSLLQARLLYRLARLEGVEPDAFGRQAVHGRVRVGRALQKGFGDLLWCRTVKQVYQRRRKNSGWSTVSTEDEIASFTLEADGAEIVVAGHPTEVQATASRTDTHERSGLFGWGHGHGDRRTVYTYLAVPRSATLVGRRVSATTLGQDNKLGLLLSPHQPGQAASIELGKGVAGLVLVTAALVIGLVIYYGRI
ncbi:MAG TPA: hypothetical protein VF950_21670 [Planctomycetota bacterium]